MQKNKGAAIVLAPPVLIELFRGVIRGQDPSFRDNQAIFPCASDTDSEILELPVPFMWKILWNISGGKSGVRPAHYKNLIDMLGRSRSFSELLHETKRPGRPWQHIDRADQIHKAFVDQELRALEVLAMRKSKLKLSTRVAKQYTLGGLCPIPPSSRTNVRRH